MHLFGIKCPICQAEKDMPVYELSLETKEESQGTMYAYAECVQCNSKFEITIPVILGSEFTMRHLDQDPPQDQIQEFQEEEPQEEIPYYEDITLDEE